MTQDASNEISRAVWINFSLFAQNRVIFAKKWKIYSDGSRYLIRRVSCHWSTLLPADKFESSLNSDKTRVEWTVSALGARWLAKTFYSFSFSSDQSSSILSPSLKTDDTFQIYFLLSFPNKIKKDFFEFLDVRKHRHFKVPWRMHIDSHLIK